MHAKADAQVAYDVSVTDQIIKKPDSVLALTCFNQAAGVSAKEGGAIFSGDFTLDLAKIIVDALKEFYLQFTGATGRDAGTVNYTIPGATALTATFDCEGMENLWTTVKTEGITQGTPYVSFSELASGTAPAGIGPDMRQTWDASAADNVFTKLNTALSALPVPAVPSFAGTTSSCQVLVAAGTIPGPCPP